MITETFFKDSKLYYVESQHVDGSNVYRCINIDDEDDIEFLSKEDIQFYINN
jgi:hypothetical protein